MTTEEYNSMKQGYLELITQILTDQGGIDPSISVLGVHKTDGKNAIVHVLIEEKFMKDDESKDRFVDEMIPQIAKEVRKQFDITAVAWASEAWLRKADKDKPLPADWKALPKTEVLFITIESAEHNDASVMEIIRKGKMVNEDGELVDDITLVPLPEFSEAMEESAGRFTGLYKKFTTLS